MRINIEAMGKPSWVEWRDGVSFLIVPTPLTKTQEIYKKAFRKKVTFENREKNVSEDFDISAYIKEVSDLIVEWKGLFDQNDQPLSCSDKIKIALLNYGVSFDGSGNIPENSLLSFVVEQAQRLASLQANLASEEKENFLSTAGG